MASAPSLEWKSLNLSDPVLKTIKEHFKFKCMTPIQVNVQIIKMFNYTSLINNKSSYIFF
jgi:superfamily II DNA/RNA helicase